MKSEVDCSYSAKLATTNNEFKKFNNYTKIYKYNSKIHKNDQIHNKKF